MATHWSIRQTDARRELVAQAAAALGHKEDDFTNIVDDALRIAARARIVVNGDVTVGVVHGDTHINERAEAAPEAKGAGDGIH